MGEAKRRRERGSDTPKSRRRDWTKLHVSGAKVFLVSRIDGTQEFTIGWDAITFARGCAELERKMPPDPDGRGARSMMNVLREKLAGVTDDHELAHMAQGLAFFGFKNIEADAYEQAVKTLRAHKVFYMHVIWSHGLWVFSGATEELPEEDVQEMLVTEAARHQHADLSETAYPAGTSAIPKAVRKDWSKLDIPDRRVYVSARIDGVPRFTIGWDAVDLAPLFSQFERNSSVPENMDWMEMRQGQESIRQSLMHSADEKQISANAMILAYLGFLRISPADYDGAIMMIREHEEYHVNVIYQKDQWVFFGSPEELSDDDALELMRKAYPTKFTPVH
jgi:hypothetical protein